MKLIKYLMFLLLLVLINTGLIISCDFTLSGKATDPDGNPIEGVEIKITDELKATTDSEGDYSIPGIPYGSYTVTATHPKYDYKARIIDPSYLNNGLSCKETEGNFYFGLIIKWESLSSGTEEHLNDVFFIDSNTGWVCGDDKTILKTTDGGENWTAQSCPGSTGADLESVFFISNNGWTCDDYGDIFNTVDGGDNWSEQFNGGNNLYSIYFVNASTGWACGYNGEILHTYDGGVNWSFQTSGTSESLRSIYFVNSSTGWACGYDKTILKTTDGGENWTAQYCPGETYAYLESVFFVDNNNGWICNDYGEVFNTTDGGDNWIEQCDWAGGLYDIYFINGNVGWACGSSGRILHTTDGGVNWSEQKSESTNSLYGICCVDSTNGWAIGSYGTIVKYVP